MAFNILSAIGSFKDDTVSSAKDLFNFIEQVFTTTPEEILGTDPISLAKAAAEEKAAEEAKSKKTRKPAKPKPIIIKWSITKWKVKNGTWVTQPILTVNGKQFTYQTPQGYIDKLIALKAVRAYKRFDTHIAKFQAALKVWGTAAPAAKEAEAAAPTAAAPTAAAQTAAAPTAAAPKIAFKIDNPVWRTSGDQWTTQAGLTIYYNDPYGVETFRGTTPADYIAKLRSITFSEINKARVERYIQEFQQAQNYWNLEILNRQLAAQQAAEAAAEMQMQPAAQTAAPSTAPAVAQPTTAVQFQPNPYPRTVTVNVDTLRVRSAPYSTSALAGSQYLYRNDQFIVTGYITGENVDGENRWWTSQFGNYVWVGGTTQKP